MATVRAPATGSHSVLPAIHPAAGQVVNTSAVSAQSAVLGATCVRVCCNQDVWIRFGNAPVANKADSIFLPAFVVEYFGCLATDKIAALRDSADGVLSIVPSTDIP